MNTKHERRRLRRKIRDLEEERTESFPFLLNLLLIGGIILCLLGWAMIDQGVISIGLNVSKRGSTSVGMVNGKFVLYFGIFVLLLWLTGIADWKAMKIINKKRIERINRKLSSLQEEMNRNNE